MCFWHIIIISIVIIIFRLNASNAVDSFLGIYWFLWPLSMPCCRYTFSRAKNGSAKVQLANWKSKAAAPLPSWPTPPSERNQSELELRLDNVPWLIMCDSLKPSSVPGQTYIEINVMAQWAYNIYTLYSIYIMVIIFKSSCGCFTQLQQRVRGVSQSKHTIYI